MNNKRIKHKGGFIKNRKAQALAGGIIAAGLIITVILTSIHNSSNDATYRETTAEYGSLTVGITESGSVEIGTVEQTFDLDMSTLQRVTTSNSNSSSTSSNSFGGMGGAMGGSGNSSGNNLFGQMFDIGNTSNSSSSSSDSNLVVDTVSVSVGQEISAGDVLLTLKSEGVEELKTELESNVSKASADLEALVADQKLSTITADYTLETAKAYGKYAETEKNATITSLQQDITDAEEALSEAKKSLTRYESQLAQAKEDYEEAKTSMNNAVWARDNADKDNNLYNYTVQFNNAVTATSTAESLENKIEQLESRVESAQSNIDTCEKNLAKAKRAYATGKLEAEESYELKMLAYNTADEAYDITISYLEDNLKDQQETYDVTLDKWNEFTSYIDGLDIKSKYNGVVTSVELKAGDTLSTGSVVVALYDADDVTMTVTVSEEDMTDINLGVRANVNLIAYPDEVFEASVTDIGDATTDSNGNTTYDVTVTITGDVSKLYQSMSGEVTFITKQLNDIVYISNRAIIRENGVSYVKIKKENGSIDKVRVETGFSDGVNVEIISGINAGDTVIIEKGDSK